MKVDRRSFFAGAAALGATAPLGGLADEAQGASSAISSHGFFARRKYDHVVVGGGFAGVAAALASARAGAKTCLLERTNVLGGLSTQGHIIVFMPLCDGYGRQVTFGIPEELLRLPMKYSAAKPNGAWVDKKGTKKELSAARYELVFDPGPMMLGLERALVDAGVDIFYDCSAENVVRAGTRIAGGHSHRGAYRPLRRTAYLVCRERVYRRDWLCDSSAALRRADCRRSHGKHTVRLVLRRRRREAHTS